MQSSAVEQHWNAPTCLWNIYYSRGAAVCSNDDLKPYTKKDSQGRICCMPVFQLVVAAHANSIRNCISKYLSVCHLPWMDAYLHESDNDVHRNCDQIQWKCGCVARNKKIMICKWGQPKDSTTPNSTPRCDVMLAAQVHWRQEHARRLYMAVQYAPWMAWGQRQCSWPQ